MAKRLGKKLDEFHWHEALDRSFLAFEFFNENVAEHAALRSSKELRQEAEGIADRLFGLYQKLGRRTLANTTERRKGNGRRIKRSKM